MSSTTPKRALTRPRPSYGINTASTPNLSASFSASTSSAYSGSRPSHPARKLSLNNLTQGSLATIPDASEGGYGLGTALDDSPSADRMARSMSRNGQADLMEEVEVGDMVDVPGGMHGIVKFVGSVNGKKGSFAGVELSEEFAQKGKNNGDVDGVSYFVTTIVGAGIFLPLNRATRRHSPTTSSSSYPLTPSTPGPSSSRGGTALRFTPPTPGTNFSKSVGPGVRASSPQHRTSRPSLPRPESPIRRLQSSTPGPRPSIGTPGMKASARYVPSPTPGNFSQSVRGTQDVGDPAKRLGYTPRAGFKGPPRSASALSQNQTYSDDETTPVGIQRSNDKGSLGSVSSFREKMQPAESRANAEEIARLKAQLDERDKQLKEQASSLAEMENSLGEIQGLMNGQDSDPRNRGGMEDKDTSQLRSMLREKNEKIAMLTAEFDAHRADFRSTIDTLEMASTETERVYEQRVQDLLSELQQYQDRTDDVDNVASQLKQLEELVQELEEGLEDARRGEAEARGEVEFLRGEVERGRSELKREREKAAAAQGGDASGGSLSKDLEQRNDEIRGLKAIIHSLSRDAPPTSPDFQKTPTTRSGSFDRVQRTSQEIRSKQATDKLERELEDLRHVVESKTNREEELERELETLRRGSVSTGTFNGQRSSGTTIGSNGTITQDRSSARDSRGTVISWRDRDSTQAQLQPVPKRNKQLETMQESDGHSATTEDSTTLWCEICETAGHDILTCSNMFGSKQGQGSSKVQNANISNGNGDYAVKQPADLKTGKDVVIKAFSPKPSLDEFKPTPLRPKKSLPNLQATAPAAAFMGDGPVAGKESGKVDLDRWCALCERDGHESVDCPFEDI